jgi:hypothetical protein
MDEAEQSRLIAEATAPRKETAPSRGKDGQPLKFPSN